MFCKFQTVKKNPLPFHHKQMLPKLMWFGILRVKRSPVHDYRPVPGCLLDSLSWMASSVQFCLGLKQGPQHTVSTWTDLNCIIEVQYSHCGMDLEVNCTAALCCGPLSHVAAAGTNHVVYQIVKCTKLDWFAAKHPLQKTTINLFQKTSALKTMEF